MNSWKKMQILIASILLCSTAATPTFAKEIVLSGSIACPATYFTRKGGKEIHDRVFGLRNYNDHATITITRIRAWDNDGTNEYDGIPTDDGFKATLRSNESTRFNASHVLPLALPPYNTQQIRIDYTLDRPGMRLHAGFAHFAMTQDKYQTARQGGSCTNIPPRFR